MFVIKQTRQYPIEVTVASPGAPEFATFHGENAQALADEYAAFKNGSLKVDEPAATGADESQEHEIQ